MTGIPITVMRKAGGGLLSKGISLNEDGTLFSDGGPCAMSAGTARRVILDGAAPATMLAATINAADQSEALVLGNYASDAPEIKITVTEKANPEKGRHGRNQQTFHFASGVPAPMLWDHDRKGMSPSVKDRIAELGGPVAAIGSLFGGLDQYAHVTRPSTSTGIYNKETGDQFPAGGGFHLYTFAQDGSDIDRALKDAGKRAWLAGLGWPVLSARGSFLVRQIIDTAVGGPERLVFEGPALMVAPLAQDREARAAIAHEGALIDTRSAIPPLTDEEERRYKAMLADAREALLPEVEAVREKAAEKLAARTGATIEGARAAIAASTNGELLSCDELEFDDPDIGIVSVADVLADPDRFHGETLSDPVEGPEYGKGKAKLYANGGGNVVVNSFAHGGCVYRLGHPAEFITLKVEQAGDKAPEELARLLVFGLGINSADVDRLRKLAAKISGVGRGPIRDLIKEHAARARHEELARRAKARRPEPEDEGAGESSGGPGATSDAPDPFAEYKSAVAEINKEFFIVEIGGSVMIGTYRRDPVLGRDTLHFVRVQDFRLKYMSETVLVGLTLDGREIWKDLGTAWLESNLRRHYKRAAFICNGPVPSDTLNLWRGWGYEPKAGDWETIAWHLLYVVCDGDQDVYKFLICLLAMWAQNPARVGEVALVLRGLKGAGKGTLVDILKRWFLHHHVHISNPKHLTGNFNSHLADCLLLFADEAFWGGQRQDEGTLKALITERAIHVEPKGINSFPMPNLLKIVLASNADWCIPVSADERRYLVCDVSAERAGDREYFNRLHAAIEGGEAEAMLHDLLALDLSGFSHRDVPHTEGLNGQKVEGLDSVGKWWMSCLSEGYLVGGLTPSDDVVSTPMHWPAHKEKGRMHKLYQMHAHDTGDRHPRAPNTFPKALKKYAPSLTEYQEHSGTRHWRFQSLDHHRAEFLGAMKIAHWDWPEVEPAEPLAENVRPFAKPKF